MYNIPKRNELEDTKGYGSPDIGANAVVIGNVQIGNNVRIGAGCTVSKSISDNSTVVSAEVGIFEHEGKRNSNIYN